jgi:hypothetical protein
MATGADAGWADATVAGAGTAGAGAAGEGATLELAGAGVGAVESVISTSAGCEGCTAGAFAGEADGAGAGAAVATITGCGFGAGAATGTTTGGCGFTTAGAGGWETFEATLEATVEFAGAKGAADTVLLGFDFAGVVEATATVARGASTLGAAVWWARAATEADPTSFGFSSGSGGSADFGNALSAT